MENLKGTDYLGGVCIDERIILQLILQKYGVRMKTRLVVAWESQVVVFVNTAMKPSLFIKSQLVELITKWS